MLKMSTDLDRHALNGATMGTRWSAVFHATIGLDAGAVRNAMQSALDEVDAQMSTWTPHSDLMRLNAAPPEVWVPLPSRLMTVLGAALDIGRASDGAFDAGLGDAVLAWGFGPQKPDATAIRAALSHTRKPAHTVMELDLPGQRARKHAPMVLDLSGIAKGYGVDAMAGVATSFGITDALLSIDGEVRALGLQPDGTPWIVAVERPDPLSRTPQSIVALHDAAVATSGDYRHWIDVGPNRLSHTMDPRRGAPLATSPASVTVVATSCMIADAWATALMVKGRLEGVQMARKHNLDALFIEREGNRFRATGVGRLFGAPYDPVSRHLPGTEA